MRYIINSTERLPSANSTTSYFTTQLVPPAPNVKTAKLMYVNIPNMFYNIQAGINDTLSFADSGGAHSLTVPAGVYTITTIQAQIQSQ